jgi:hypothetical protein
MSEARLEIDAVTVMAFDSNEQVPTGDCGNEEWTMSGLTREALEFLCAQAVKANGPQRVGETDEGVVYVGTDGERFMVEHREVRYENLCLTIPSLVTAIGLVGEGRVWVNSKAIRADLAYGKHTTRVERMPLNLAEERDALEELMRGVNQRDLWELLATDLHGCLPPTLMLAVGSLKVSVKREENRDIEVTGVSSGGETRAIRIRYGTAKGDQETEIPGEWTWCGRWYQGWDKVYEVPLRLIIDTEDGLRFRFVPRRICAVQDQVLEDLVQHLDENTDDAVTVVAGDVSHS